MTLCDQAKAQGVTLSTLAARLLSTGSGTSPTVDNIAPGREAFGSDPDGRLSPQELEEVRKTVTEMNTRLRELDGRLLNLEAKAVPVGELVREAEKRLKPAEPPPEIARLSEGLSQTQTQVAQAKAAIQEIQPQVKALAALTGKLNELCGLYPELCALIQASKKPRHLGAEPPDVQGSQATVASVRAVKVVVRSKPQPTEQAAREPERFGFFRTTPRR